MSDRLSSVSSCPGARPPDTFEALCAHKGDVLGVQWVGCLPAAVYTVQKACFESALLARTKEMVDGIGRGEQWTSGGVYCPWLQGTVAPGPGPLRDPRRGLHRAPPDCMGSG
jgi:hypothetical protein